MTNDDHTGRLEALYRERGARLATDVHWHQRRTRWVSHGRLALFIVAAALAVIGVWRPDEPRPLFLFGAGLAAAGFVAAVLYHTAVRRRLRRAQALERLQDEAIQRLHRRFDGVPGGERPEGELPAEAADLDLVGPSSLLHLLDTTGTSLGRTTLLAWLLGPAAPDEIRARQEAVRDLGPRLDLRQEVAALARTQDEPAPDLEPFLVWAEGEPWITRRPLLVWAGRLMAPVALVLIGLDILDWTRPYLWVPAIIANLVLGGLVVKWSRETFARLALGERGLGELAEVLALLSRQTFVCPRLRQLQKALATGSRSAHRQLQRLDRLVSLADLRASGMVHAPVLALTLWDIHVWVALEVWQRDTGRQARGWLEALAQVEALSALAGVHHDHPDWAFPEIVEDPDAPVVATALGHPLLPPARCVRNDVQVGPPGTFLLVTGSNMSGKSTLLRAVGANVALAQAGGVVCAETLRLPPLTLGTSFRIDDSLAEGVSYFMAELRRLKQVVDLAEAAERRALLYLFDEILLGTNVVERQIAVQRVIGHLLRCRAVGAVATHDLTLAEADGLVAACHPVHLRESFVEDGAGEGTCMTFDYRLRDGVAPTTNALALLRMVGLPLEDLAGSPDR